MNIMDKEKLLRKEQGKITCECCNNKFAYKNINIDKEIRIRLTHYACSKCCEEKGKRIIWDNHVPNNKEKEYFEVFKILDHKVESEEFLFLVSWAGYPSTKNSWLPPRFLDGCHRLMKKYFDEHPEARCSLPNKLGCSLLDPLPPNENNWVEIDTVIEFVKNYIVMKKGYNKNLSITKDIGDLEDLAIFSHEHHAVVARKFPTGIIIADGTNDILNSIALQKYMKELFFPNPIKVLEFKEQVRADECASSAAIIAIEFCKTTNTDEVPNIIWAPKNLRRELRKKWHAESSQSLVNDLNSFRKDVSCPKCGKKFKTGAKLNGIKLHITQCQASAGDA